MPENKEVLKPNDQAGQEAIRGAELVNARETEITPPNEVADWLTRLEKNQPQQTINDSTTGAPMLQPAAPQNPVVKLPITRSAFVGGFKKSVSEAGRWISAFFFRWIKIKNGAVEFKRIENK